MKNEKSATQNVNNDSLDARVHLKEFPYKTFLSFEKIIEYWEERSKSKDSAESEFSNNVLSRVKNQSELLNPIVDLSILDKHQELVDLLMSPLYPKAEWNDLIKVSLIPFQMKPFYATPQFDKVFGIKNGIPTAKIHINEKSAVVGKTLGAISFILKQIYNINFQIDMPFIITVEDGDTGLDKYYRLDWDSSFLKVKTRGEIKTVTEDEVKECIKDISNFKKWLELLPPENFEIHRFTTTSGLDVTDQEVVSSLKYDLLEKETIISNSRFNTLQKKIQSYFGIPDLRLGLAALPKNLSLAFEYGKKIGNSILLNLSCKKSCNSFNGSIYEKAVQLGRPVVIENFDTCKINTDVEKTLHDEGL